MLSNRHLLTHDQIKLTQINLSIISITTAKYVQVLHKALEVAPHRGEVIVRDALLGAKLPNDGPQLGKVHVVDAREQVVLDVVVDAALEAIV